MTIIRQLQYILSTSIFVVPPLLVLLAMLGLASPARAQTSLCCPADVMADTQVDPVDLALLLSQWGGPGSADIDGDGTVRDFDLAELLNAWGACPSPCELTRVVGSVRLEDGSPYVAGVTTDLGCFTPTNEDGGFSLLCELPKGVSELTVTATVEIGNSVFSGSAVVSPVFYEGTADAGVLTLVEQPGCIDREWLPTFGSVPGLDGTVFALAIHDDGSGPTLYAGGSFTIGDSTFLQYIARWNGTAWSGVGGGMNGTVRALVSSDFGTGPMLYAGGEFSSAGGVSANKIARWNGSAWSALGGGTGSGSWVRALAVYDDGDGPQLYAATSNSIARWNGLAWNSLGNLFGGITSLLVHDDGSGAKLYAGGSLTAAAGVPVNRIARWNGTAWSAVGAGIGGTSATIRTLCIHDDGSGPRLFVGGTFTSAGGVPAQNLAAWDGVAWSAPSAPALLPIDALASFDDGSGPRLVAAGSQYSTQSPGTVAQLSSWNGKTWSIDPNPPTAPVHALLAHDDVGGPMLFAGGQFTVIGNSPARRIARLDATGWRPLGGASPTEALSGSVSALTVFDDGSGPKLYAGGSFRFTGSTEVNSIACWDGKSWSALGGGVDGEVLALAGYDNGTGPKLYAAGRFSNAGGVPARRIACWNGTKWTPLGSGLDDPVTGSAAALALAVYDAGGGPELYASGLFTLAGGVPASRIARWNGSIWSALNAGTTGPEGVSKLLVYDDGSGAKLYAAGEFSYIGGVTASKIASWDGSLWSPLGSGMSGSAQALAVHDDGTGRKLYVAGPFTGSEGGTRLSIWNGSDWSAAASQPPAYVLALAVHDDGAGPKLHATIRPYSAVAMVARLEQTGWTEMIGAATASQPFAAPALISYSSGSAPGLYVGGGFERTPSGDAHLGRVGCPSE